MKYINFAVISAITGLLKIEHKMKRDLCDLLSNKFTSLEVDKAIHDAVNLKLIKQTGLIKARNHEQTRYMLVKHAL